MSEWHYLHKVRNKNTGVETTIYSVHSKPDCVELADGFEHIELTGAVKQES